PAPGPRDCGYGRPSITRAPSSPGALKRILSGKRWRSSRMSPRPSITWASQSTMCTLASVRWEPADVEAAGEAAVGDDRGAGDRRRLVAREEERDVGDLGRTQVAPERVHRGDVVERAPAEARELLERRRHHRARTYAVGTDVLPAVLERHRARQVDHAALGRVVRAAEDAAVETLHRRRIDDRAAAAREHARDRGAHPVEDPGQHDAQAPFPDLRVQLAHVAATR